MQLPPKPSASMRIQQLRWALSPMSYMDECAQKHGDMFRLQLGKDISLVFTSNPDAIQTILTNDTKDFSAPGELNNAFEPLFGKHSLITISGKEHQRQRQLLMPPLHGERMRSYGEIIENITSKVIQNQQLGKSFSLRNVTQTITLQVMMQAVFGLFDSPRARRIEKLLGDILDATSSPLMMAVTYFPILGRIITPFHPARHALDWQQEADNLLYEEIRDKRSLMPEAYRRQNPDASRSDILSLLMAAEDEYGNPMTDVELRDELITLLVAGHETTATAIAWAIYYIHKYPHIKSHLLTELATAGDNPDSNVIFKLPYLNAVCNETLRIHPVAMLTFPRKVEVPVSLCGYDLEAGTVIYGSIYLSHRRPDLYPNPDEFKPERFLEKQFSSFEFLPFGGGVRRCIGLAFAQFEMKLVLAKILASVDLELVTKGKVFPVRRGLVSGQNRTIQMLVKSRNSINSGILLGV
ncbi:cytochrome P450 [Brunnivagina elsteri]|uniref:Cytochrome P450 n=1 Tax=Brunnivagina elsteri CCALA 953 TaxID=987040 RepID=A0A2A2TPV8_9CYAN|nr:cytochrome P450 [Calothrix elsteri]PAX60490.1 cytochrome P450 [Calothrix elsteri CCALA 953]